MLAVEITKFTSNIEINQSSQCLFFPFLLTLLQSQQVLPVVDHNASDGALLRRRYLNVDHAVAAGRQRRRDASADTHLIPGISRPTATNRIHATATAAMHIPMRRHLPQHGRRRKGQCSGRGRRHLGLTSIAAHHLLVIGRRHLLVLLQQLLLTPPKVLALLLQLLPDQRRLHYGLRVLLQFARRRNTLGRRDHGQEAGNCNGGGQGK